MSNDVVEKVLEGGLEIYRGVKIREDIKLIRGWLEYINKQMTVIMRKLRENCKDCYWKCIPNNSKISVALVAIDMILEDIEEKLNEKTNIRD